MSVVAAAAAVGVGVGPGAAYGQPCGGGGARKRKDVVQDPEAAAGVVGEEEEEEVRGGGDGAGGGGGAVRLLRWREPPHGLFVLETVREGDDEEEGRSSIGAASGDEDEGEEVQSRRRGTPSAAAAGGLACMDALDDALPIKRGLSSFFSGRSRSFANLQDAAAAVSSARDLAKPENPFNKRRRVLRCSSIRRVASTSLTALPPFRPPAGDGAAIDDDGAAGSG
ncbi:hypothetical protein ACP4OV_013945 [Aristida adscensionis]